MIERNVTQADIARTGFVKSAAVSMFFSYKTKSVGVEMCRAISAATNIPLEVVYQKAGLLPLKPDNDPLLEQIEHVYHDLRDPANRQRALDYVELLQKQEKKGTVTDAKQNPQLKPR